MNPPLIDSHNHLQDPRLTPHLTAILAELTRQNVGRMVVNGTRPQDWAAVAELARRDARVLPSYGVHPWYVAQAGPDWRERWREHLAAGPAAVGEIGLDRWIAGHDAATQEAVFLPQWREAAERNLPVTIHCLRAWGRLLEISRAEPGPACGFLLHSYGGPVEMVPEFAARGAYFSLSGYFAQPRKARAAEVFRAVPADRLLLETDAPDMPLPPERVRFPLPAPAGAGEGPAPNHPANLAVVYEFAAGLLGRPLPELAARTSENFHRLFGGRLAESNYRR